MAALASAPAAPAAPADAPGLRWREGGALEPPIRSVLFGQARLEQHGASLAATHEVLAGRAAGQSFFPRLEDNIAVLRRSRDLLAHHARDGHYLGPAAHWLLDNATLLDEQLQAIRRGLPRGFFRLLPRLRHPPLAGLPRIYGVAWAWVAHTDSGLDAALLAAYLRAYQHTRALTLAELWALPSTLRVVLVENLRRLAERTAVNQAARDAAHQWLDQDDALRSLDQLQALEPDLARRGVTEAFALQLQQREDEVPADQARSLSVWLAQRLPDAAGALARQQAEATEDHQSIRNAITTLRAIDRIDWRQLFAATCPVMQTLARSPVHAAEREDTQDDTLHAIERLAREGDLPEARVAQVLCELCLRAQDASEPAAAPAHWWQGAGQPALRQALGLAPRWWPRRGSPPWRRAATTAYLGALALGAPALVVVLLQHLARPGAPAWLLALAGLLLLGPVGEAVVALVNRLISESARPARLPRLALDAGIPPDHRVIVVVPCMLTGAAAIDALCQQLEQHAIANPERQAQFALLSDFLDAEQQQQPGDAALLGLARQGIEALNQRHPPRPGDAPRFLLLHRERVWSVSEQRWIGWERKRGKLEQLVRRLSEPDCRPFVDLGPLSQPAPGTRYIVTLDADTDMPPGRLRDLVGVAAHPLNLPRVDMRSRRVVAGYGILQPRLVTPLPAPDTVTRFHRLFSGQCGIDPYSAASSELYQDLFDEGSFTGKGLLHVQALHWTLVGRLPDEQVLSHDLLEGAIARCAGVSDVTLVEDAPVHADVAHSRLHRWARGDWQLLPFLLRAGRYGLPAISRWKMADNLRRSLVAPMSLALLLLALASGVLPLAAVLAVVLAAFSAGPLLGAVAGLAPSRDDIALRLFYRHALADVGRALMLGLWHLAQLLQLALLYGDAIVRALYRQWVSRRGLLQWTTAAAAQAAARQDLPSLLRQHVAVPLTAAGLGAALALAGLAGAPVPVLPAAALLLLWAASPVWTWVASRPRPLRRREQLDAESRRWLLGLARDTWRFYERHVGADDHHLPPDNVQFSPRLLVAHRTSPTNIGLYLLGAACAQALGFIGRAELAERLAATLDTLDRLPRHLGHFYNWYDTQTLAVLPPAYVSTVDSGNCSGHLLAVARACELLADQAPDARAARAALAVSAQRLRPLAPVLESSPSMRPLAQLCAGLPDWPADADAAAALRRQVDQARQVLDGLNLGRGNGGGSDDDGALQLLQDHLLTLDSALRDLQAEPAALADRLRRLAARSRSLALAADFGPLYDPERRLLHIGLRVETGQLDDSHYDLLASESRLTSLLAIAKGDVPVKHWAALGRPFFACGLEVGLKSWSGSMFEYLMPSLLLEEPIGSVLHQVARSAVRAQQDEARPQHTPWGISESAIAAQDHTLAYQYGPQGVPALALRRTPAGERVVAPYASAMAVMVAPMDAVANLRALQALGARRSMGFIEAIDYTPQRQAGGSQAEGSQGVPVHTFMAHHQAMSLVAFADVLTDGAPRHWAMSDPLLRAVGSLLHERAPREVPQLVAPPPLPAPRRLRSARLVHDVAPLREALPATHLLTNGHHAVVLRSHGGGYSQWDGVGLTRWRDDLPRDDLGTHFYLRRDGLDAWQSITARPAPAPEARYSTRLQADRMVFDAQWPDLLSRCTVWVSPEDDCELRQVELSNTGHQPLRLTLASCAEITLAPARADEAHPAFSNLFVQARWDADEQALYFRRQPRLADEQALLAVHFLALSDGPLDAVSACVDRARWLGRYGSPAQPLGDGGLARLPEDAADPPGPGVAVDTGLDPVASIAVRLRLAPGATVRLTFCTAASRQPDALPALVDKYRQPSHAARASSMSHTMAGIRLRELQFDADAWRAVLHVNTLLTSLASRDLPTAAPQAPARCDRRLLWRHGLSGDRPIVLVTIHGEEGLPLVTMLKKSLRLWSAAAIGVDLVVLNAEPASYLSPVQHQLQQLRERVMQQHDDAVPAPRRCSMLVLVQAQLDADELCTLNLLARLRLQADGRPLAQQIDRLLDDHARQLALRAGALRMPLLPLLPAGVSRVAAEPPDFRFDPDSGSVHFAVSVQRHPARPWINLLANPDFGCQVSELGGGCVWAGNSRLHQIIGWSNDALRDTPSEWLLLQDLDTQRVWPLGRALQGAGPREVVHGLGFSRMQQRVDGLDIALAWCVDADQPVRQLQLTVRQAAGRPRRLRVVALAEWTLGGSRAERLSLGTQAWAFTPAGAGAGLPTPAPVRALLATQLDHLAGFGGATAWLAWRPPQPGDALAGEGVRPGDEDWTCDRREFHDESGRLVLPARLAGAAGLGLDACAALGCELRVAPGSPVSATLLLGHAPDLAQAQAGLRLAWAVDPAQRLARQRERLQALLGGVQVRSPDPAFDALVNHWLPYQTLVCRLWGRAGFYQAGGAYGFRDQLQDAMSLVSHAPALLAGQLRLHASRQFAEGDVQHWWHPPGGAGVRTHFSDDLLWLPLACALYVQRTGDAALLDERIPFLVGAAVPPGAEDVYETPQVGDEQATLYEHAARAVDRSLRTGRHGLPLFGTGDWNDGMNRVGHGGQGESVWLAWFLCSVVDALAPIAAARGDTARVQAWAIARAGWQAALDGPGWDGAWYRRGYFDDGSPLGAAANPEGRIDLIAQAWAVLSGAGDPDRARQAMASAQALLVDPAARLVRLLDPPLRHAQPSAGYIQSYPPGVRENGGQYNHAAVWAMMALARLGDGDAAWRMFTAMSPAHRWADAELGAAYALEPYVMAGDIYTAPPYVGRGGWSWYTGSAGWLARAAVESICGVVLAQGRVTVQPALPGHWREAEVTVRHAGRRHRVVVCADAGSVAALRQREPAARQAAPGQAISLQGLPDGSVHWVLARVPADAACAAPVL